MNCKRTEKIARQKLKKAAKAKTKYRKKHKIEGLFFSGWNERSYDFKALEKEAMNG